MAMIASSIPAEPAAQTIIKSESFDRDPGWEGFNNRLKPDPKEIPTVEQNFGYSDTHFAGGEKGELGGKIWRSVTPAFYAARIPVKTLNDKLTASGRFVFTASTSNAGVWFGWFNSTKQKEGLARPSDAFGLDFDFQGPGSRLSLRLENSNNHGCGGFVTPYVPGKFRTAPLTRNIQYAWTMTYDPQANSGNGRIEVMIRNLNSSPEHDATMKALADGWQEAYDKMPDKRKFETTKYGRPDFEGKVFTFDVPAGFKQEGATFDHFGLMNHAKEGSSAQIYFDDLEYDGQKETFAKDPGWEGVNNRTQVRDTLRTGYHDFGFSPNTHFAGGALGEMGGIFWRLSKAYGYYADRIGPLTLDDPLEAHGKVLLKVGTPDCEMCFGWFNSSQKEMKVIRLKKNELGDIRKNPEDVHLGKTGHFLGVYLTAQRGGIGLLPAVVTAQGTKAEERNNVPRPDPDRSYDWSMRYDPAAANGNGVLTVTLAGQTATLALDAKLRQEGATFDRFGFFPSGGGGMVHIYFDDLKYTAGRK
jgi:hypothetical protein